MTFLHHSDEANLVVSLNRSSVQDEPTRESVIHFFEMVHKKYSSISEMRELDEKTVILDTPGNYSDRKWVSSSDVATRVGISRIEEELDTLFVAEVLEAAPGHLDFGALTLEMLTVAYNFTIGHEGNHDQLLAQVFAEAGNPFDELKVQAQGRMINYQPYILLGLGDDIRDQVHLTTTSRSSFYDIENESYPPLGLDVYFSCRRIWHPNDGIAVVSQFQRLKTHLDRLVDGYLVPRVLRPLQSLAV